MEKHRQDSDERHVYRWDGDNLIAHEIKLGKRERKTEWIYEPDSFRPLAQINHDSGEETLSYAVTDYTGTVSELYDENGTIQWQGRQEIWGKFSQKSHTENAITCDLRYQGQIADKETGLCYNRHRYYDSQSCQYLSSDPIGLAGGIRPNSYVADPVNWVDPLGLEKKNSSEKPDEYQGVKDASEYLKEQGVPREYRKQTLESFDINTIKVREAGMNEYGLRYFDGVNAQAKGRYVFETFPATRGSLAVKSEWNKMTNFTQFKINPGTTIIEGKAAAQGIGLPGGQLQKYVPNLDDLVKP